jgi:hypothetical protein
MTVSGPDWAGLFEEQSKGAWNNLKETRLPRQTMSIPVFQGKSTSVVVAEGDALSAMLACDASRLVLAFGVFLFYL